MVKITKKQQRIAFVCLAVVAAVWLTLRVSHHALIRPIDTTPGNQQGARVASKPKLSSNQPSVKPLQLVSDDCVGNKGKLLLVSISSQHMWACDGSTLAKESAVTTGASALKNVDDSTPTGTWAVQSKQRNLYLNGCDVNGCWHDFVKYWIPFSGDYGFHDSSWQKFSYGSSQYKTDGSHGCVHLPLDMISWVYNWAGVGTTVKIRA